MGRLKKIQGAEAGVEELAGLSEAAKEQADLAGKAQKKVLMTRTARQQEDLAGMLVKLVRSDPSDISRKMEKRAKRIRHLTTLVQLAIRVFNAYDKKTIYRK